MGDALIEDSKRSKIDLKRALEAAYAIDFAAHQQAMQAAQDQNKVLLEQNQRLLEHWRGVVRGRDQQAQAMQALRARVKELEEEAE